MPKVTMEFALPEEKEEYRIFSMAQDMNLALWEFSNDVLRSLDKHGYIDGRELTTEEHEIVSYIREAFHRILNEHRVEIG